VIDLAPVGGATSAVTQVLGVDIATGEIAWTLSGTGATADPPDSCGPSETLCLSWETPGTQELIEVNATDGSLVKKIPDVRQNLGMNLYGGTGTPMTLMQIGSYGQLVWQKPLSAIFGTSNDDPANGWDIDKTGSLYVGSLGSQSETATTVPVGSGTTTAFEVANGRTVWTDPGLYNCGGSLESFSTATICRFHGNVKKTGSSFSTAGVSLVLEGFAPQTGKVKWSQPTESVAAFIGQGVIPFLDGNTIVMKQGKSEVLVDLASGSVSPVRANEVFWCASTPTVNVTAPTGTGYPNQRAGSDLFYGCNSAGQAVPSDPDKFPGLVGFTLGGKFFWPSPSGLEGVEVSP
jgi:hypothetical protein